MIRRFLVAVSGANPVILAQAPGERVKQESLGGVVLTTSSLAALSMGFALHMALHAPVAVAAVLAVLWGLAIANFDRWVLTATTRQRRWWANVGMALPRLGLALIIGLVVSTPLTLQAFTAEINDELTVMQAESQAAFTQQIAHDARYRDLPAQRVEIRRLETAVATPLSDSAVLADEAVANLSSQLAVAQAAYERAEQAVVCEHEGTCGSNKVGAGPAYREKVAIRDEALRRRDELSQQLAETTNDVRTGLQHQLDQQHANDSRHLADLRATVASSEAAMAAERARNAATTRHGDGLLARLEALGRVTARDPALGRAHLALFLFFTAIECLPVVLKLLFMIGRPSLYEELCALADKATLDKAGVTASAEVDAEALRTQLALDAEVASLRDQHEAEQALTRFARTAQQHLARRAVLQWEQAQTAAFDANPEVFFTRPDRATPEPTGHPPGARRQPAAPSPEDQARPAPDGNGHGGGWRANRPAWGWLQRGWVALGAGALASLDAFRRTDPAGTTPRGR